MTYERKDGDYVLFTNKYKKMENQPDYRGEIRINGVDMEMAGWKRIGQDGKAYLTGRISEKQQPAATSEPPDDSGNDLPF